MENYIKTIFFRSYLKDEYADKKGGAQFDLSNWSCIHVKNVPQQMNGSDCGMFTCKYAEYISRGKTSFSFNQVKKILPKKLTQNKFLNFFTFFEVLFILIEKFR